MPVDQSSGTGFGGGKEPLSRDRGPADADSRCAPLCVQGRAARRTKRPPQTDRLRRRGPRTTQLFDLDSDPLELNDLADDPEYRDLVAGMREELHRWRTELGDTQEMGVRFWEVPSDVR